ncbi:uncharacterized protein GGS25DRAFT_483401 [Hypoxylon fragiforme]|uniref:uncharacterized protein n=1 Tax=Hypoxylon fragiforme TaxID=63214 RepID=UPI0020C626B7|nr:uncharacterized protein GGS25DRAFT_483401 [Hypoxylon fragiforme]KAI2611616.1 hypothetical protein GGS25DRAFT_483401 [Hypoxylon fragiforme]
MSAMDGGPPGNNQQEEEIPAYQRIAPSIFVPAHTDFTQPPPDLPSDPSQLRNEMLARIDEHADAVQDNIYYMLNREKRRIHQECRQRDAYFPQHLQVKPGLAESEEHWIPDNGMELDEILFIRSFCPEPKQGPYEVPPLFTHNQCLHLQTDERFGEPPRKSAEKMLLNLVKHGVQNLEGLAQHVKNVKDAKSKELENEMLSKTLGSMGVAPADRMDIS